MAVRQKLFKKLFIAIQLCRTKIEQGKEDQIRANSYWSGSESTNTTAIKAYVKTLSEILGHANVSTTLNTYVHSSMERKREQLEKLFVESY